MEELQKQNEILAGRLEKAKEVFKDQKKQIDEKNTKIAEQQAMIDKLNEQLKNASNNEELNNKLKEYELKVNELEGKWNDKVIENDDLALELNKAKNEAINVKKELQASVENSKKEITELTNQLNQASADLTEFKKVAENEIAEAKKKAAELVNTKTKEFEEQKANYENKIKTMDGNLAKLNKELADMNVKLDSANKKLTNAKENNTSMQNEVKEVIKRVQNLDNSLTTNFNIFQ